jgi:PhzF family phenazine biosynthesis protein
MMLRFTRSYGLDTAFIVAPRTPQTNLRIRYFVPEHEMGVCGHATIAAVTVALHLNAVSLPAVSIETISGSFGVRFELDAGTLLVTLNQRAPEFGPIGNVDRVSDALGIDIVDLADGCWPVQSVSVSRWKLLVPIRNRETLDSLCPRFESLWEYCEQSNVTGIYAFTLDHPRFGADAEARQYPLRAGFPEDAATGVAAAALGAYLSKYACGCDTGTHEFVIGQGLAMGAASRIAVSTKCENGEMLETAIRGTATIEDCHPT